MITRLITKSLTFLGYPFYLLSFWLLQQLRSVVSLLSRLARTVLFGLKNWKRPHFPKVKWPQIQFRQLRVPAWIRTTFQKSEKKAKTQQTGTVVTKTTPTRWSDFLEYEWSENSLRSSNSHHAFSPTHSLERSRNFFSTTAWRVGASVLLLTLIGVSGVGWWVYQRVFRDLPSVVMLETRPQAASTRIYDRNGELLYKVFEDENRTPVPLSEMSPTLVQATLAIEDTQFYEHWGVSLRGIIRAAWHNANNDTTHGGSTITQQLVKNTLLNRERSWERKIREAVLAFAVDLRYSKPQILEWYLNDVNYGGAIYGAEEASQWYFGKSARDLSLAESALLAGLPNAPTLYNPFGPQPERSRGRQLEVLRQMETLGFITAQQRQAAEGEALTFRSATYEIQAPHFVMMIRDILAQQYGEERVAEGGLEVWTSLDLALQASAEAAVQRELSRIGRLNVSNGAAMVTDPRSGEILAMVGSRDYFDTANDGQVNVALRQRQPGSSIKPLTYALAFEGGMNPETTIEDSPVQFASPGAPPYAPKNYDGKFHGKVTLRESLGSSYNIPAVRLLAQVGVPKLVELGQKMGLKSWSDPSRFGLALTLGGGEVTMYEMAQAYGTFANSGETVTLNPILEIKDVSGKQIYENPCRGVGTPCQGEQVLRSETAAMITDVLSDNGARTPAFGARSALVVPNQEVAVKTGTTNSLRDNWTIGYTTDRVVLTWVGNNDNKPMSAVASGVTGASPIWNTLMTRSLEDRVHRFAAILGGGRATR